MIQYKLRVVRRGPVIDAAAEGHNLAEGAAYPASSAS